MGSGRIFWLVLGVICLGANAWAGTPEDGSGSGFRVVSISPSGAVDDRRVTQIRVTFSEPIIPPEGARDPDFQPPVTIEPNLPCEWRMAGGRRLACDMPQGLLRPATRYRVRVSDAFQSVSGSRLESTVAASFTTRRPEITQLDRAEDRSTDPGQPVVSIRTNLPVRRDTLTEHLEFVLEDGSHVDADVLAQDNRGDAGNMAWDVMPRQALPGGNSVSLRVAAGLESVHGPLRGEPRELATIGISDGFRFLGLSCKRHELVDTDGCNPARGVFLHFSAPPESEGLAETLTAALSSSGEPVEWQPNAPRRAERNQWRLPVELSSRTVVSVSEVPAGALVRIDGPAIHDVHGRPLENALEGEIRVGNYDAAIFADTPVVITPSLDGPLHIWTRNVRNLGLRTEEQLADARRTTDATVFSNGPIDNEIQAVPLEPSSYFQPDQPWLRAVAFDRSSPETTHADFSLFRAPFNLTALTGPEGISVWTRDWSDSAPIADAEVALAWRDPRGKKDDERVLTRNTTDSNGMVRFGSLRDMAETFETDQRAKFGHFFRGLVLLAEHNGNVAELPISETRLRATNDPSGRALFWPRDLARQHLVWGTTDKHLYRAGETVRFQLYLSELRNGRLIPTSADGIDIVLQNVSNADTIATIPDVKVTDRDGFSGRIEIPRDVSGGHYVLQINRGDSDRGEGPFSALEIRVSDFDKRRFRTTLRTTRHFLRQGESFRIRAHSRRLNGGAYGNADTEVAIRAVERDLAKDHPRLSDFTFLPPEAIQPRRRNIRRETSTTYYEEWSLGSDGKLAKTVEAPNTDIPYGRVKVAVGVRDEEGEFVYTSPETIKMANRARYVGLSTAPRTSSTSEPVEADTVVVDREGNPVDGATATATLKRFDSDADEWLQVDACHVTSPKGSCGLTPEDRGAHRIVAKTTSATGESHKAARPLYVLPERWRTHEEQDGELDDLKVATDRDHYGIGDKVNIRFSNPFPETRALLVFSRERVVEKKEFQARPGVNELTQTLDAGHAPNIDISVVLFAPVSDQDELDGEAIARGRTRIDVDDSSLSPVISIATDKDVYKPGDPAEIQLRVRDGKDPVPDADVTLSVVDSGLVELLRDGQDTFNPVPALTSFRRDWQGVLTTSLAKGVHGNWLSGETPGWLFSSYPLMSSSLERARVTGSRIDGSQLFPPQSASGLRQRFRDVAGWATDLRTDEKGRARTTVELPGNLTEWTIVALAVTPDMGIGFESADFDTQRKLETNLSVPDSVYAGDSFTASATVYNRTETRRQIEVRWDVTGAETDREGESVVLPAGGQSEFHLPLTMGDDNITLSFSAIDGSGHSDGIQKRTKKRVSHVPVRASRFGSLVEAKHIKLPLKKQRIGPSKLNLTLSPSLLGQIDPALAYNAEYPHQCWEQELSRAVSIAVRSEIRQRRGDAPASDTSKQIADILTKASSYQDSTGEMAFFKGNGLSNSPWLTAYTVVAFSWLKELGYAPPGATAEDAADYLTGTWLEEMSDDGRPPARVQRILSFLLTASAHDDGVFTSEDRKKVMKLLDLQAEASITKDIFLVQGLAEHDAHRKHLTAVKNELRIEPSSAGIGDTRLGYFLSPATALDCHLLTGLARLQRHGNDVTDLADRLANNIVSKGETQGHWGNTHANAVCAWSLYQFADSFEKDAPSSGVTALLDGKRLGNAGWTSFGDPPVEFESRVNQSARFTDVRLSSSDNQRAYYAVSVQSRTPYTTVAGLSRGLSVKRAYAIRVDGDWARLAPGSQVEPGELVRVTLRIDTPEFRRFVALQDPVPAGLDPINSDLTEGDLLEAAGLSGDGGGGWPFTRPYFGDEQVRAYASYLWPGTHRFRYYAQAGIEGEFQAPPAHVEVMYEPENHAYSEVHRIRVKNVE